MEKLKNIFENIPPLAVLPIGLFFLDFGPDPDFFQEIGPEMVRIWLKMEELTLKIDLFHHGFNDEVDVLQSWKCLIFSENTGKSLILRYWSGFKAYFGPDLVRIGTKKWSGTGPILIKLSPIWQVVALLWINRD